MNPYWLIVASTVLMQFGIFLRWLHRRMREAELQRVFVRDIARIHLPHLYYGLQLIASRLTSSSTTSRRCVSSTSTIPISSDATSLHRTMALGR